MGPTESPASRRARAVLVGAIVFWGACVGSGMAGLARYSSTEGAAGAPPQRWPASAAVAPSSDRVTLLMFAHPRCPCTRASLGELAELMARTGDRVDAHVLFVRPEGAGDDWDDSDLEAQAAAIPGVKVSVDGEARQAELFRSTTSGHVLVYGADGALLFSGGITAARGHMGDNLGVEAVRALARGAVAAVARTSVFGCALAAPERAGVTAAR
jgi:hypothetical protein